MTTAAAKPTARLAALGQSLWLDNITRTLLDSGTLARYIRDLSVTGLTSNPTIFEKAIGSGNAYDAQVAELAAKGHSIEEIFFACAISDLTRAADLFADIHRKTKRVDGWVSLEVSPLLANDTAGTVAQAVDLHARAGRPNLYIKVPGTPEGCPAIEELIFRGVPINVTLLFSREQYIACVDAYTRGIERRVQAGLDPFVCSVASVFVSRWDRGTAKSLPANLQNTVGIAMAGRVLKAALDFHASPRWKALAAKGATEQRVLWASTGTKDPALSPCLYCDVLGAPNTVNTIPEETLLALAEKGNPQGAMPTDGVAAEKILSSVTAAGVDLDKLAETLQLEGRDSFNKSWADLLAKIASKREALAAAR
jgi:transaldolase